MSIKPVGTKSFLEVGDDSLNLDFVKTVKFLHDEGGRGVPSSNTARVFDTDGNVLYETTDGEMIKELKKIF